MKSKRIGILMGGLSAERQVSMVTGEAIYNALAERGYNVVKVFVDRDIDQVLRQDPIDVAFIALHGSYGEDGCIQGLLEILEIPYTGSAVTESALAMDKLKSKELFRLLNVPTPPYYAVHADQIAELEEIHGSFGFPVFVKPRRQGSSIGAGRANSPAELGARCEEAAVYDYRSKYQSGQTEYHFPARLAPTRYQGVLRIAERAVHAIGAPGAVRVDMLTTDGENEYVLEVNTLPGMTPTSLLPKIARGVGYDFGDLCEAILCRASLGVRRLAEEPEVATAETASVAAVVSATSR
jgi:D-alanine-D-alanine ligase